MRDEPFPFLFGELSFPIWKLTFVPGIAKLAYEMALSGYCKQTEFSKVTFVAFCIEKRKVVVNFRLVFL